MESMEINREFWKGKEVLLTGHTGFKGGWMALWLNDMGANVHGYALRPPASPSFFVEAMVEDSMRSSTIADIRDIESLQLSAKRINPDIVIHMAAQPLVLQSYKDPMETYMTNIIGTVNLLEVVRNTSSVKAVVNITTDKCYKNREWVWPYRENEAMGGHDPYSSSKACAELITSSYRHSFLKEAGVQLASARAGNVIGGGDWAENRLIPDFIRSLSDGNAITIRSPQAIRPWQHVLEPLSGYIKLAENLYSEGDGFAEAWNFGPNDADSKTVQWIIEYLCEQIPNTRWKIDKKLQLHESNTLKLDSSKANTVLGWTPKWSIATAIDKTIEWHTSWKNGENMSKISLQQIKAYEDVI
jgi:CDP-glucose 4,6-dehydratase